MNFKLAVFFGLVFLAGFFLFSNSASAATPVSGTIASDTTWTLSGSPYIVQFDNWTRGLLITNGATLTLEPGVVVKFEPATKLATGAGSGSIQALGTAQNPIIFTAITDDLAGGDTNGDGGATAPQVASWIGLELNNASDLIEFAEFRYSGEGCIKSGAALTIRNNKFLDCGVGIFLKNGFSGQITDNHFQSTTLNYVAVYSDHFIPINLGSLTLERNTIQGYAYGFFFNDLLAGQITIRQNDISQGRFGLFRRSGGSFLIDHNNIQDNPEGGILNYDLSSPLPAQNNFWGHASGPFHPTLNPQGQGNSVSDGVDFIPWLGTPVTIPQPPSGRTPVIIVPGIPGTELWNGSDHIWADLQEMFVDINDQFITDNLVLDANGNPIQSIQLGPVIEKIFRVPILDKDIFEGLRLELEQLGYIVGQDLFFFPYDWRLDLEITKDRLKQKIEAVKLQTGSAQVDIIAHSMGGILTKTYLDTYGKASVRKLVFVGTPHLGAPKAAKVLLRGDRFSIPWLEPDRIKELALNMPSLYELLPQPVFFTQFQGYIRPFTLLGVSNFYDYNQTKDYLLNQQNKNSLLYQMAEDFFAKSLPNLDLTDLDAYNLVGCRSATQAGYQLGRNNLSIGMIGYTSGDGTVPQASAEYLNISPAKRFYVRSASHVELPSTGGVRELILGILEDNITTLPGNISNSSSFCSFRGKQLLWRSPVEVHVYDQLGNHTGPIANNGVELGVPGVDYEILDDEKFVFVPTDDNQQYSIVAKGLAQGTFDLRTSTIDNGQILTTQVFNDVPVNPASVVNLEISDQSLDNALLLDPDGAGNTQTVQATAVLSGDATLDLVAPTTTLATTGIIGQNGWFRSNVSVSLSASDGQSGVLDTFYSLDGGSTFQTYIGPILLTTEGTTTIPYSSVDQAGNNETLQSTSVKIDKTPPEAQVAFAPSLLDIQISGQDNLSSVSLTTIEKRLYFTDEAGQTTELKLKKTKELNHLAVILQRIGYNGARVNLPRNKITYEWATNSQNQPTTLVQTLTLPGNNSVKLLFNLSQNRTMIIERKGKQVTITYQPGLVILNIKTNKGKVEYGY